MTGFRSNFEFFTPVSPQKVKLENNTFVSITRNRKIHLDLLTSSGQERNIILNEVMLVPSFEKTRLFSREKAKERDFKLKGKGNEMLLYDSTRQEVMWVKSANKV